MQVLEKQTLSVQNVISTRRTVTQEKAQEVMLGLMKYVDASGAKKAGSPISVTYSVDAGTKMMDVELYLPIDKEVPSNGDYTFKPELCLHNCVKITHKGHPMRLQSCTDELNAYILKNKLAPVSPGFMVNRYEVTRQEDLDLFEVDIYVSVAPTVI